LSRKAKFSERRRESEAAAKPAKKIEGALKKEVDRRVGQAPGSLAVAAESAGASLGKPRGSQAERRQKPVEQIGGRLKKEVDRAPRKRGDSSTVAAESEASPQEVKAEAADKPPKKNRGQIEKRS
jgi:hypothetical protein